VRGRKARRKERKRENIDEEGREKQERRRRRMESKGERKSEKRDRND
jgi:hypothetical protein